MWSITKYLPGRGVTSFPLYTFNSVLSRIPLGYGSAISSYIVYIRGVNTWYQFGKKKNFISKKVVWWKQYQCQQYTYVRCHHDQIEKSSFLRCNRCTETPNQMTCSDHATLSEHLRTGHYWSPWRLFGRQLRQWTSSSILTSLKVGTINFHPRYASFTFAMDSGFFSTYFSFHASVTFDNLF